jgi:hypothetical protein
VTRREPRETRLLGLWTAAWLGVFLLVGLLWVGDLSLQWPVLLIPVVWALVALRPRRTAGPPPAPPAWGTRSDTVERPAVHPPRDPRL